MTIEVLVSILNEKKISIVAPQRDRLLEGINEFLAKKMSFEEFKKYSGLKPKKEGKFMITCPKCQLEFEEEEAWGTFECPGCGHGYYYDEIDPGDDWWTIIVWEE